MRAHVLTLAQLQARLAGAAERERLSPLFDCAALVLDLRGAGADELGALPQEVPNCPVIASVVRDAPVPPCVDVACTDAVELTTARDCIEAQPIAALLLVQLLRHNERASIADGLFAESLSYSALQSGAGFRAWRAARPTRAAPAEDPLRALVQVERRHGELRLTLDRPEKRNAYSAPLRDALVEALQFALDAEPDIQLVVDGRGPAFCAGGDLDEFGRATDAAHAHALRMTRSAALLIDALRTRIRFEVHGACIGAGIELPAFGGRIVARADAFFALPEVGMGLIPGAGGTVSILRRIGRLRLASMAVTGQRVDAPTALRWGLIDAIS